MMNLVSEVILNIILVLFPILIYFVFSCYESLVNKSYSRILFYVTIITSVYLCLKYTNLVDNYKLLLILNVPIVVAYIKKEKELALCISFIVIFNFCNDPFEFILLIVKYVTYFFIYLYCSKNKGKGFVETFAIFQAFFLAFDCFFYNRGGDWLNVLELFITMVIFYFVALLALYLFKLANNITTLFVDVKQLEEEKEIKNSLFKLTHEIKNPLAVCKGYLDMLDTKNVEKTEKYIMIIKQEIEHSLNIMSDFLEFSKLKISKSEMDIAMLLEDVYDGFKILLKSEGIKLNYEPNEEDENYIYGDYDRLKQVMLNLLKNSSEAIEGKGNITIKSYSDKDYYYIEIIDDGKGMSDENLEKIKNIFFTTKKNGNGIGVSLSNEIIKAHDGKLTYKSELGRGTVAEIKIPIKKYC